MTDEEAGGQSAITRVRIGVGRDGLGRYTALYGNGEKGPVSEGYGHQGQSEARALKEAADAARRDFPWLEPSDFIYDVGE